MKKIMTDCIVLIMILTSVIITVNAENGGNKAMNKAALENEYLRITLDLSDGIVINSLYDKKDEHEYILRDSPLFNAVITQDLYIGGYRKKTQISSTDLTATDVIAEKDQLRLSCEKEGICFTVIIENDNENACLRIRVNAKNETEASILLRLEIPAIQIVSLPGDVLDACAMIPDEIGAVGAYSANSRYGNGANSATGLPTAFNTLEVAAIFENKSGHGVAFSSVGGEAGSETVPIQMRIDGYSISGYWADEIVPHGEAVTPDLAVYFLQDGWTESIDRHMALNHIDKNVARDIPDWLRSQGAIYSTRREGSGGSYQCLPGTTDLNTQISDFHQMPELLEKARQFGTNVLLMVDYYERADLNGYQNDIPSDWMVHAVKPYWNKGDYIPRPDLGGVEAFCDGIRSVHEQGGKVIVYVEPYIVFMYSQLGRGEGRDWAAHNVNGTLDQTYFMNYTMQPATIEWQNKVVEICERLVGEYDVDGIMLDSLGWQWNHLYYTTAEKNIYSMNEYNRGLLEIEKKVRTAIRNIKQDAVVISESGAGLMIGRNDGGFTADYCWSNQTGNSVISVSPTKYAFPEANLYSSGLDRNSLNQVFAAGWSLTLCDYWAEDADYIRSLVSVRQQYADALINGQVSYPASDKKNVGVYRYVGDENELLIAVNGGNPLSANNIMLGEDYASSVWDYVLEGSGEVTADDSGMLRLKVPKGTLCVLKRR